MTTTRMRRRMLRPMLTAVFALGAVLSVAAPASASPIPPGSCGGLEQCIANLAKYENSNDDGHKYEKPMGSNCNYFSTQWHAAGAPRCSNGWYAEAWCMDFARWVWKTEGASVQGLDHTAYSAKNYATYKSTASGRKPKIGDLAVWASLSHVGVVVNVTADGRAVVVSGNWDNSISKDTFSVSTFQGFAAPKAA